MQSQLGCIFVTQRVTSVKYFYTMSVPQLTDTMLSLYCELNPLVYLSIIQCPYQCRYEKKSKVFVYVSGNLGMELK